MPAIEPVGRPVCCLKRSYSWLGFAGVCMSSPSRTVLVGLVMAEAALDGCLEMVGGVGEGSWLKSKSESVSGSKHWLAFPKFDGMVMA